MNPANALSCCEKCWVQEKETPIKENRGLSAPYLHPDNRLGDYDCFKPLPNEKGLSFSPLLHSPAAHQRQAKRWADDAHNPKVPAGNVRLNELYFPQLACATPRALYAT